jgi:hypothetical protein
MPRVSSFNAGRFGCSNLGPRNSGIWHCLEYRLKGMG